VAFTLCSGGLNILTTNSGNLVDGRKNSILLGFSAWRCVEYSMIILEWAFACLRWYFDLLGREVGRPRRSEAMDNAWRTVWTMRLVAWYNEAVSAWLVSRWRKSVGEYWTPSAFSYFLGVESDIVKSISDSSGGVDS